MATRSATTHAHLKAVALELFEARGYRGVTVEDIAAAADVSHMTFYRHFPSKDRVLLDDPFDPLLADAVAAQPRTLAPVERVARGLLFATQHLGDEIFDESRRGIAMAAGIPELEAGMMANMRATENAIVERAGPATPGR